MLSFSAPEATHTFHGWILQLEGACWARLKMLSSTACGTGFSRKPRTDRRALIAVSRLIELAEGIVAALTLSITGSMVLPLVIFDERARLRWLLLRQSM
jgi:hypothetical protein